jgi:iron complex outermembrane recepter protein
MRLILIFIQVLLAACAFGQASLRGAIRDTLNQPVANAVVYLPELNRRTLSDSDGNYHLGDLQDGSFVVQITHIGYRTLIATVQISGETVLNVSLLVTNTQYPEVVVYGFQNLHPEKTANEIVPLSTDAMRIDGATSLSDGMSKLPGVYQLTTGGISKPVIRGLFGNRVQTVLLGLRFDNQQWQDEHGLGLSDIGVDRIEIIKGPASLLYGSEAMGGVLNIIEEKPAPVGTRQFDFSTRFFSNTMGVTTDVGFKGANNGYTWRIRAGMESHADYFDGNGRRILNSRFGGYYAKASFGVKKGNWLNINDYAFSMSNFGFLMDSINLYDVPDPRNSRSFDRPHHTVYLHVFSSQNTFFLAHSKLKINAGFQVNNRMEQEGGNKISLDMLLNTYILNALWTRSFGEKTELSFGTQDFFQTNRNAGSRSIIPDANQFETSLFSYLKQTWNFVVLEGGVRFDLRQVNTYQTGNINIGDPLNPGNTVLPFSHLYTAVNGALGLSLFDGKHWNFKTNISSGYRPGNLAELSSNGLHEGTVRYEIGDINLEIEQNVCADAFLAYNNNFITLTVAGYYNQFFNYIYLQPTTTEYIGFQIFRYIQKDAVIQGTEFTANIHPKAWKWMNWNNSFSAVQGTTSDGEYLPFIPAPKINTELKISFPAQNRVSSFFIKPGFAYVFEQDKPNQFETATDAYYLVNGSAGITLEHTKNTMLISAAVNNLLNETYYDHLSRFKYFGVYNQGRNVSVNFKMTFK